MPNPMNCDTCDHKKRNRDPALHCYMFKDEPVSRCGQHSGFKRLGHEIADDLQAAVERPQFYGLGMGK